MAIVARSIDIGVGDTVYPRGIIRGRRSLLYDGIISSRASPANFVIKFIMRLTPHVRTGYCI